MAPSPSAPKGAVDALNAQIDAALTVVQPLVAFVQDAYAESKKRRASIGLRAGVDAQAGAATAAAAAAAASAATAAAWDPPTDVDALALARDAAALVRAHATKISLLIINEPFTPSAVGRVVQELVAAPVPSLARAVEVCYGDRYTHRVRQELARRCASTLVQVQHLLEAVPRDGRVLSEEQRSGGGGGGGGGRAGAGRGSYTKVGILWAECDGLVAFCNQGVGGHLVETVNQLVDTIKDEQEELREWGEEEDDDDDEDDDNDDVDDSGYDDGESERRAADDAGPPTTATTQAMLDALMATRHIPADDPQGLRARLATAIRKMGLVGLLCRAVVKRRLSKLPAPLPTAAPSDVAVRLDGAVSRLQAAVTRFEDLAAAFYKLDAREVDATLRRCLDDAAAAAAQLARPWAGTQDDEFTAWAAKFQTEIQAGPSPP